MKAMRIGIAQVDATPPIGLPLMGNYRLDYAARGIHDPLISSAVVFVDSEGDRIAMLALDVCGLDSDNIKFMRECIFRDCGISKVLIHATHTHSGPAAKGSSALPKEEKIEIDKFLEKAASAVALADKNMEDLTVRVGHSTESRVSFNRRLMCTDGVVRMNWENVDPDLVVEPCGLIDPEVIAVSLEHDGEPVSVLVNFAIHPAVLAGDNWLYSADFPGYLREGVGRLISKDIITTFFNGCCGNINHIDYKDKTQGRGYQMTQRIGYMLAVGAHEALQSASPVIGDVIACSSEIVPLKRVQISEEKRKWSEKTLADLGDNHAEGLVDGIPDEEIAEMALNMYKVQGNDATAEVIVIRIGDLGIVGLPSEAFCEDGMEIKRKSPAKHTIVIEQANDGIGYMPTRVTFDQGGYETIAGVTRYERGEGDKLVASALAQLDRLFK